MALSARYLPEVGQRGDAERRDQQRGGELPARHLEFVEGSDRPGRKGSTSPVIMAPISRIRRQVSGR